MEIEFVQGCDDLYSWRDIFHIVWTFVMHWEPKHYITGQQGADSDQ